MEHIAHISLGSNILPHVHLPKAIETLSRQLALLAISSVYETLPVGSSGPNFLNAVAVLRTPHLTPHHLKEKTLRPLEAALGRQRTADKFAARTIDLDILAWDGKILDRDVFRYAHLAVPLAEVLGLYPLRHANRRIQRLAEQFQRQRPLLPLSLAGFCGAK
ncbi:MAG: 2-amino-4-hydroxy-6-hydroxymethyldihydropteridine diphosphokinase [Anaerolineales bacterium]|nr:2-amino-4-hydroxy-6-hydroxymethyldihydropteridine diphosphokinase [Anaerolineales bacterium]MCS7247752.1 2-amino-4-hydroxy-6-hydroxymethyldihydropteridine diphosphokinase [Anaerolineales bacterium]MDW8161562.1 2-amino-4-hydroxy-6-hydroxymethyldihydropteridine diphosphokinase [Anaerolineales bacterium]MDW8446952.1 2-amino-4-hydroxy-6-hydroxymethyldihydropteridine diphosphokinase [Anaerolineales bacterium]